MNDLLGETSITVGEKTYVLSSDWTTLMRIEEKLKKGSMATVNSIASAQVLTSELATIIREAVKGAGGTISEAELGELFAKRGIVAITDILGDYYGSALYGKSKQDDAEEPTVAKKN